jgi:hypothetical protein
LAQAILAQAQIAFQGQVFNHHPAALKTCHVCDAVIWQRTYSSQTCDDEKTSWDW